MNDKTKERQYKLAKTIQQKRKVKYSTQNDFADKLGMNRSTLASYESGRNCPSVFVLDDMAKCLGLTIEDFLK